MKIINQGLGSGVHILSGPDSMVPCFYVPSSQDVGFMAKDNLPGLAGGSRPPALADREGRQWQGHPWACCTLGAAHCNERLGLVPGARGNHLNVTIQI